MDNMNNHRYMRDYVKGEKGPWGWRIFSKVLIHCLVFSIVFLGVPLPQIPQYIPEVIRRPLEIVKEAIESPEAEAAIGQIKRVQRGMGTINSGDSSVDGVFTNDVTMSQSFVIVGGAAGSAKGEESLVSGRHVDPGSLLMAKGTGKAGAGDIYWQVVDFGQGVSVQKGAASLSSGTGTKVLTLLSPVDQNKSFALVTRQVGGQQVDESEGKVTVTLTDPVSNQWTTVTIDRAATLKSALAEWQVITFEDANVYYGTFQLTGVASTTKTAPTDFTAVTANNSFIVVSDRGTSDYYVRGEVTNGSTLTFTRATSTGNVDVSWYLVEMTNGSTVQAGVQAVTTSGATPTIVTLGTAVPEDESYSIISTSATSTEASASEVGHDLIRNGGSTELKLYRSALTGTPTVAWQVITSPPIRVITPNGSETLIVGDGTNPTGDEYEVTWTAASTMANVKLEYSTNGGQGWSNFVESEGTANDGIVTNDGAFTWEVPDGISVVCLVRISDSADSTRNDSSDAVFEIKGSVTLTQPVGGEAWLLDTSKNVIWTYTGAIGNVRLGKILIGLVLIFISEIA